MGICYQMKTDYKIGHFLRSTSLDELSELLNMLKGDMSLLDPIPLLMEYLPYFTPEQNRCHDVMPGITGWAQVNGRNTFGWEEKIVWLTIAKVWKRDGIRHSDEPIMPRFDPYMKQKKQDR